MIRELSKKEKENFFKERLMIDINNINDEIKKKRLMKLLDDEPELLDTLSNKQLERVYKIYLDEIEKKKRVLDNLKNRKK